MLQGRLLCFDVHRGGDMTTRTTGFLSHAAQLLLVAVMAVVAGCGGDGGGSAGGAPSVLVGVSQQQAYVKASNTGAGDRFGTSVALSADGNTLAVGAFDESSNATGINGNQADNSAPGAGAVYVYTRSGG